MAKAVHTMIRVFDEARSTAFYKDVFGLNVVNRYPFDGFTLTYLGLALGLQSPTAVILLIPCLMLMTWGVILREECYLTAKFGQAYLTYKQGVRRWL